MTCFGVLSFVGDSFLLCMGVCCGCVFLFIWVLPFCLVFSWVALFRLLVLSGFCRGFGFGVFFVKEDVSTALLYRLL